MTTSEFKDNFISYYLLLEKDFKETMQYVTVSADNGNTYSVMYLKLLLAIGSEISILIDFLAKLYEPKTKESGFGGSKIILKYERDIKKLEVVMRHEKLVIRPWDSEEIPKWWTAYNNVKHDRYGVAEAFDSSRKYFQYANQINVLNALAALFSLELYVYRYMANKEKLKVIVPNIVSIFTIKNLYWEDIDFGSGVICVNEELYIDR